MLLTISTRETLTFLSLGKENPPQKSEKKLAFHCPNAIHKLLLYVKLGLELGGNDTASKTKHKIKSFACSFRQNKLRYEN